LIPLVYLGCPEYFTPDEHSILARYSGVDPGADELDRVVAAQWRVCGSSLLPKSFNALICEAMDLRDAGKVTHFAMLHDDIWPDNYWINTLWREMRLTGADLVSVVSPIKDQPTYRSSTAIGLKSDPWVVPRYIRPGDRKALPTTFSGVHVCGPGEELLVNTGCFLADLRHDWWDEFCGAGGFNFATRITREPDGSRLSWIQPEDWRMSRFLAARGAKLAATYAVRLRHRGQAWWSNYDDAAGMPCVHLDHPCFSEDT
jgi:hypothetical protein